jgi:hypothetical protein
LKNCACASAPRQIDAPQACGKRPAIAFRVGARRMRGPNAWHANCSFPFMIRKLPDGRYRLYSRKVDPRTKRRKNLGTFASREAAERHERAVQYFKRRG